ncbi:MAG: type II toxin-antitoxin system HigA family antitoxin [Bacteroidales bacterium]|jgi:HTH-type transcriptional regulator/antitoxin HigA
MNLKVIKTEKEYKVAVERIYELMNSEKDQIEPGSSKGDELELLALLVESFEDEQFPKKAPDPIDAIRFRMDQMNLMQKDIAPLFGGETRASEVLNGRRPLSLKMITILNRYLDIPLESLIGGNNSYKLDASRKKKIMSVPVLREFLARKTTAYT